MNSVWELMNQHFGVHLLYTIVTKLFLIVLIGTVGFAIISAVTRLIMRALKSAKSSPHVQVVTQNIIFYIGVTTIIINAAHILGFDVSVLLGAAGVAGVAIGFASQTSMSNLISGLFLLSEGFLKIGDEIICDSVEGRVESIDLFSVKVKTSDGKLVRIPNEQLLKTHVVDVTYYKARQSQISITVPADTPYDALRKVIDSVVHNNRHVEHSPRPSLRYESVSSDTQQVVITVWASHASFSEMENSLIQELSDGLARANLKPIFISRYQKISKKFVITNQ